MDSLTDTQPTEKKPAENKEAPCLVRGLAFVLALLLVLAIPLSLLAFDVWRVVFNPELIKRVITDEVVNSDLIPIALEWFSERRADERVAKGEALTGVDEPDIVLLMSYMDRDDWRDIKTEVLTDEFLTHMVSVTVDGTYGWIDSADRVPQITWDLAPFIDRVNSEHGENSVVIAYDNLPPCTEEQINDFLARLAAAPPNTEVLYNLCEFPDPWHDDQFSDYVNALFKVVDNVPRQFALTEELSRAADQGGVGPEALKEQLRTIRLLAKLAPIVPLVLLVLILAVVVRSLKGLGRWWGIPLVLGGVLALLPLLLYRPLITNVLSAGALTEVPELIIQEAIRIALRLGNEIFRPMLLQSIVIIIVGLGLAIAGAVVKGKEEPAEEQTPADTQTS